MHTTKHFLIATLIFGICLKGMAQVTVPSNAPSVGLLPAPYGTPVSVPSAYNAGILVNYMRSWVPRYPVTSDATITSTTDVTQVNVKTQYFDGLGRSLQSVAYQASPNKKDIVTPIIYDAYGREQYKYLPYTATTTDGRFKLDPFTDQATFFSAAYPAEQGAFAGERFYYGHTNFEASPLNRVLESYSPGNSWAGSEGSSLNKSLKVKYLINTQATDAVRIWTVTNNSITYTNSDYNTNIPVSTATYADGKLFKTVSIDEHGNATVEYKDSEGLVVLKKVQSGNVPADYSGYTNFLCTYYVYDIYNNLRFVIQPKAVALMITSGSWALTTDMISELSFRYEYDGRQRLIAKKIPGAAWAYFIYDAQDRIVFTQDGNLGAKYLFLSTLYDGLDRPVETGMLSYTGTPLALQAWVTNNTGSYVSTTSTTLPNLTVSSRVAGQPEYIASTGITFQPGFSSETGAVFVAHIDAVIGNNTVIADNPIPTGSVFIPLTYTSYDGYANTAKTYNNSNNSRLDAGSNAYPDALPASASKMIRGLVTVTKVRVIENPADLTQGGWLEMAMFYDDKGRAVQVQSNNYKGGLDVATSRYNFTGQVICNYVIHNNPAGGISNLRIKTNNEYDFEGRLLNVKKNINDDTSAAAASTTQRVVAQYIYDALGNLKEKKIGQKTVSGIAPSATTPMEDDSYAYNIRGWLKGTNWNYPATGSTTPNVNAAAGKWFGMDLSYDWGFGASQYNGNISGQRWMNAGDKAERSYGYGYDAANRLLYADFNQNFSGSWQKNDPSTGGNFKIDFSIAMGTFTGGVSNKDAYDENGNILRMQQNGIVLNSSQLIDNLSYSYEKNGTSNKLRAVADNATPANVNLGDFVDNNTTADDYGYDINGNLMTDLNKRMSGNTGVDIPGGGAITYNHLNLPYTIAVKNADGTAKGTITYIYDAIGSKLEKRTLETPASGNGNTASQTVTSYLGAFVYQNNTLQYFGMEEGRIRPVTGNAYNNSTGFAYDYILKDHLGNTRVVLTDELQQDTYPVATFEANTQALNVEKSYYNILDANIVDESTIPNFTNAPGNSYNNNNGNPPYNNNPSANTSAPSVKLYKLNGATGVTNGLGITLKVMTGDVVNIYGKSYWHSTGINPVNTYNITNALSSFINAFAGTGAVFAAGKGATGAALNGAAPTTVPLTALLNNVPNPGGAIPKAYINWILFDEQFRVVSNGFDPVSSTGDLVKPHSNAVNIDKGGYLYVYCSNESNYDVFFDNIQVIQTRGPLLETDNYYPFGLTMAGISSQAAGKLENLHKYNGKELQHKEFSDGSGLEWTDYGARDYDAQVGRWFAIDPLAANFVSWSPYTYTYDEPMEHIDPDGRSAEAVIDQKKGQVVVKANLVFYGGEANRKLARQITRNINKYWNRANGKVDIDGKSYSVKFKVTFSVKSESQAAEMAKSNSDIKSNFIRLEKNNRDGVSGTVTGRNSGDWITKDNIGTSSTSAHEFGHLLGLGHAAADMRNQGQPGIMAAKGTLVDARYTLDPTQGASSFSFEGGSHNTIDVNSRVVTQSNITGVFSGVNFTNGKANIGSVSGGLANLMENENGVPIIR